GATTELIAADGVPGPVRGIASLGTEVAVLTAGPALLHLDYRDSPARLGTLLAGLATPWSVVVDPLPPHRVYVSERGADRILAVELDTHGEPPVVVRTLDLQSGTLEGPGALALEHDGSRILIATNPPGGGSQLVGLDLGAKGGNAFFPIGEPSASEIASVASGPDGLRLLARPGQDELRVAGGVEQRRTIRAYEPQSPALPREQRAEVDPPFDPAPRAGMLWRIPDPGPLVHASAQGVVGRFIWDSAEAHGSSVSVRATARDDDVGVGAEGAAPKTVRSALDVAPLALGGSPTTDAPLALAAADLDGDGDLDLVSANIDGDDLTVFFQTAAGSFDPSPLVLGGDSTINAPAALLVADLDGDGGQDLVSADEGGDDLRVFLQHSLVSFAPSPLLLGGSLTTEGLAALSAADLDGDGDLDLASANFEGHDLTIFFQDGPRSFDPSPLVLGDSMTTV
ncbi:MAG: FG-GAP-like repeat-containing protein, partial [Chloroflexi bacterium]|nr:FG-GAP-like repeat-containing protein [Chloroflexota bacterium]